MKVNKKIIAKMPKCYSIGENNYKGEPCFMMATEKEGPCKFFDFKGRDLTTVWTEPGGVMTMVALPESDGSFMATQKFYSPNDSDRAYLVIAEPHGDDWKIRKVANLPFVHRFNLIQQNNRLFIIACTLKSGHNYTEDWTNPGKIFVAELDKDLSKYSEEDPIPFEVLADNLSRNHGYTTCKKDGVTLSVVSTHNGVLLVTPPTEDSSEWQVEKILEQKTSDACLIDLDQDGKLELVTYSPFHGDELRVYKETEQSFELVYEYPKKLNFLHSIDCGLILGDPGVIVSHRRENMDLMILRYDQSNQSYYTEVIDENCGSANVMHVEHDGQEIILSANREVDQAVMYFIER